MKNQLIKSISFGSIFFLYALVLCFLEYTIVPVDRLYIRGNLPWKHIDSNLASSRLWNYSDNRSGDAIYQTPLAALDHLNAQNDDFSFSTTLGYPLRVEYGIARGLTVPLAKVFHEVITDSPEIAVCYSMNIVCGIWGWFSFVLLWLISYLVIGRSRLNWIPALAVNPIIIVDCQESWLIGLSGILAIIFSIIFLFKNYKDGQLSKPIIFLLHVLVVLGTVLMFRSAIFHYYLYVPLLYCVSFGVFRKILPIWMFFSVGGAMGLAALIEFQHIYDVMEFLSVSNKSMKTASSIGDRGYAFLPFQQFFHFGIYKPIIRYFQLTWDWLDLFFTRSYPFIGYNLMALFIISIFQLPRYIKIFVLFVLLYWMGPVQYLLSLIIRGPFATESSGRMGNFVILFAGILAVWVIKKGFYKKYSKILIRVAWLGILFVSIQSLIIFLKMDQIWVAGILEGLAAFFFICFLRKDTRRLYLYASFLTIPLACSFLFSEKQVLQAFPVSLFSKRSQHVEQIIQKGDVAALVKPYKKFRRALHPTFWNLYGVRNLHAYRNPYQKEYSLLFWAQYAPSFEIKESNENYLLKTRIDRLVPLNAKNGLLNERSRRFIELAGVNLVAAPTPFDFKEEGWRKVLDDNGVGYWKRKRLFSPFRFASKTVVEHNLFKTIDLLLSGKISYDKVVVLPKNHQLKIDSQGKVDRVEFKTDSVLLNVDGGGLLTTNILYYKGLRAMSLTTGDSLKIMRCNAAFVCVGIPENSVQSIKIHYVK